MSSISTSDHPDHPQRVSPVASGRTATVVAIGLALLLVSLRLIHLGADTPPELSTSDGLYVDEGYKTLSPRNLVLFGTTHWSPADHYEGWMSSSPITQWSYYASFRLFGANIEAARYVTVLFLALFLFGFVLAMRRRYGGVLLLGGLAVLGLESTLFFLSRIAVFEFPIITFLYLLLFVFAGTKAGHVVTPVLAASGISVLLIFGIKVSALLYLTPVFLASSLYFMLQKGFRQRSTRITYAIVMGLALVALLVITRNEWLFLMEARPLDIGRRLLENPLAHASPVPILAGLLCTLHLLVCRPDLAFGNLYRINLTFVTLLGFPLVALFDYDPLRYYSPLLPVFVLVVLEWIHLRGWKFPAPRFSPLTGLLTLAVMVPWLYYLIGLFLPYPYEAARFFGKEPGLLEVAVVVVLAAALWVFRSVALRGTTVVSTLLVLLVVFPVSNTRRVGSFLLEPTFQAQQIRSDLVELLPEDSILGGVWAPFFALGTPFKALYIAAEANYPERLPELAPDYVVYTHATGNSRKMFKRIRVTYGMFVGPSVYRSNYNQKRSTFYPLLFNPEWPPFRLRGPYFIGRSLMRAGDLAAAELSLRVGLRLLEGDPAADPVWVAEARRHWGSCLTQLGRYAEAEQVLLLAYQVFRPGGEAPAQILARKTLKHLVELYRVWNKPEQLARYHSLLERYERRENW